MKRFYFGNAAFLTGLLLLISSAGWAASDVPVPQKCTPAVNARLAELIQSGSRRKMDNVMVCGVTTAKSRTQRAGAHGAHEIIRLQVDLPGLGSRLVQIAINDELDGPARAPADATVFAYGQAYFDTRSPYIAGIHDVHCSTHRGADNGWVVVNGKKYPESCR